MKKVVAAGFLLLLVLLVAGFPAEARHQRKKVVPLTGKILPGPIPLTYARYRAKLLSSKSIMDDLKAKRMTTLDMWKVNVYGMRITRDHQTARHMLPRPKPTGLPELSYQEYRAQVLSHPEAVKSLHNNHMTIHDIWVVNQHMSLREFQIQEYISRDHQRRIVLEYGIPTFIEKISSGKFGDRFGTFWIDYKQLLHVSWNIKGCQGVPMSFARHFDGARWTHSSLEAYGMGNEPRSHGCVRQYCENAIDAYIATTCAIRVYLGP